MDRAKAPLMETKLAVTGSPKLPDWQDKPFKGNKQSNNIFTYNIFRFHQFIQQISLFLLLFHWLLEESAEF